MTAGQRLLAGHVSRRPRDDDLLAVSGRADARGDHDVHPHIALVAELGLARVDADSQAVSAVGGPWLCCQHTLDLGGSRDRVARAREREKAVAGPVNLRAVVLACSLADELCRRARAGANRSPRRYRSRVDPSTSAKRSVTVPDGSWRRASSDPFTREV